MTKQFVARRFRQYAEGTGQSAPAVYEDLIDLSIGDTDYITDKRIIDAAYEGALAGYTRYGNPNGDPELVAAIRTAWKEDFGEVIPEGEIVITASSCMGMALAMLATVDPGDEVIVFGPYFFVYKQQIELAGGVCVEVPTVPEEGYRINEELLRGAVTPKTKAIILNNPCNPTGAFYDRDTLEKVARVARENDLLIVADEIYTRYVYEGEFVPIRTLPGMAERTLTLNSFSKNFMMTGWRIGCAIGRAEILRTMMEINGGMVFSAPGISQRAAIRALSLRDEIEKTYIEQYRRRTFYAAERAEKIPYLSVVKPKGTFYLFPGIEKTGLTDEEFCEKLLREAHIRVTPGYAFGESGRGHFRIACTVAEEKLREAFDRMEKLHF